MVIWTALLPVIPIFLCPGYFNFPYCWLFLTLVLKYKLGKTSASILIYFSVRYPALLSSRFSFSTNLENGYLVRSSVFYSNVFLSWIILMSIIVALSITDPQGYLGQHCCLYFKLYSCPIACFVVLKVFNFYLF